MSWNKVKIDQADKYFSLYIRTKAGKCANCGKLGQGDTGILGLQSSHYHGRRKESVRFDEENVDVLCIGCHRRLGTDHRLEYDAFKLKQLGQKAFDALTLRANLPGKKERKLEAMFWKKKLTELANVDK